MYLKQKKVKCEDCFRPVTRRLALFEAKDEYECYAENYVKCFWGLCDQHTSNHNFTTKSDDKVIMKQPRRQEIAFKNPSLAANILLLK